MKGEEGGAWSAQTHKDLYPAALNRGLAGFLIEHIRPKDLLDFGSGLCGIANLVADALPLVDSYCIEPDIEAEVARGLKLLNIDITSQTPPGVINRRFDLVMSIEVAEHIPRNQHELLFDFLVARAGKWIVFSGARPGQGGHGHVAERPELDWRSEFLRRGCCFEPKLSALARNLCDEKNINHRQNIQVFRAPVRDAGLMLLENRAAPFLSDLLAIAQSNCRHMTGNLFFASLQGARSGMPEHSLLWKRENLLAVGRNASNILEIGFAGGHSALLFLLAGPKSKLTVIDPLELPYAKESYEYLRSVFPNQIELLAGFSQDILPSLEANTFDLVHIDGGKEKTIEADLQMLRRLVTPGHVLAIDDTQNKELDRVVLEWEEQGDIETAPFVSMNRKALRSKWKHRIARFRQNSNDHDLIIKQMLAIFRDTQHPSIYTRTNPEGQIRGRARADALIDAVRNVENQGLTGAFVEVGVAAGHSSIIAALASSPFMERDFFLYDTFHGFVDELPDEIDHKGVSIRDYDLSAYRKSECKLKTVRTRMLETGISPDRIVLIEGPVESTVEKLHPHAISILRLDADLYEPTLAALTALYDLIQSGGYLIVDDYGHWRGCREAVDRFFSERGSKFDGIAADYTCYVARK